MGNLKLKKKLFHEWTKYFPHFPLKPNKGNMEWMECHLYFMMKPSKSSYIQLWLSPLLSQNTQIGSLTWNAARAACSSFNFFLEIFFIMTVSLSRNQLGISFYELYYCFYFNFKLQKNWKLLKFKPYLNFIENVNFILSKNSKSKSFTILNSLSP